MREWRNWTGDQRCRPARVERPTTLDELRRSVSGAVERGERIRVAGAGHSFNDIALAEGTMLNVHGLNRLLSVDRRSGLVKVEAGITLRDLNDVLQAHGLAMENLGDIDRQTLAGAISTATHGTGVSYRNISAQIEAMELVLADGAVVEVSAESDPDAHRAARVGLGSLGALYAVTIRAVPDFTLRRLDSPRSLEETLDDLEELGARNDHFEFFVFPHTDTALLIERNRTAEPPRPRGRVGAYVNDVLVENYAMDLLARAGKRFPSRIPALARFASRQLSRAEKVDRSYRVFASERRVRFTEMEYALPQERGAEAVRAVLDLIESRKLEVGFPIEFRLVAGDDSFLSPAHERDTAYVAVHQYQGMDWERYFRAVEEIMDRLDGRPHWGKRHFQTADTLPGRYPRWVDFQRVRARLDPEGWFQNAYTERVLGPVATQATIAQRNVLPSPR